MRKNAALVIVVLTLGAVTLWAGDNPKFVRGSGEIGWVETTVEPQVRCAGGEPADGDLPCTEGTNRILTRGEVGVWWPVSLSESVAELLNGPLTFQVNCNFNEAYRGPCWGTFVWEVPGMGTWEGHWTAPVMDLMTYESELSMVGYGAGEGIDGMHLKVDGYSNPGDWYITLAVRIATR
jgi:hypothetical protein